MTQVYDTKSSQDTQAFLSDCLNRLLTKENLSHERTAQLMRHIMQGECPDVMMAGLLIALRMKGESIDEVAAAASTMLAFAHTLDIDSTGVIDIVGTGGDGANLFNVSTASAFVVSSLGVKVAKHGNKGVSSSSGASDLLAQAGVRLDLDLPALKTCLAQKNLAFLFAPNHHPAIKYAIAVRQALKVRTIFNLLGPLTNPAKVKRMVIGVYDKSLCPLFAEVLKNLGAVHALVVASDDGLDEISLAAPTHISELKDGNICHYVFEPSQVGMSFDSLDGLSVKNSLESLTLIKEVLAGKSDSPTLLKAQNLIALNAGAALYVAGKSDSLSQGVALAKETILGGQALVHLESFAAFTQSL